MHTNAATRVSHSNEILAGDISVYLGGDIDNDGKLDLLAAFVSDMIESDAQLCSGGRKRDVIGDVGRFRIVNWGVNRVEES